MANPVFKTEVQKRTPATGEFYANGILMNRKYNLPQDKTIVREIASGKLMCLDRAKDFKPELHEAYNPDEEPKTLPESSPTPAPVSTEGLAVAPLDDISYDKAHYELLKQKGWTRLAGAEREAYKGYKEKFGA